MQKPLILIVDDTLKNVQLLGTVLKKADYEISIATDGKRALELLETVSPDLILLDIMMPDIDGYEVCENIKQNSELRSIPIIFLTGKTDTEDIVKAFETGAADYVTKPFRTAELLARVRLQLELKQARDNLRKSNSELERLNKDKDQFLSIVAHDLRSPFQGILGLTGLLKNEFDCLKYDERKSIIELIDSSVNGIYKLVENLLSWSLIESGKYKLIMNSLTVEEVVQNQLELFQIHAKDKLINLEIKVDNDLYIYSDEQAISTILRNLISNAIKFTPREGRISVSAKRIGNHVEFCVSDTGVGLEQEVIDKITGHEVETVKSKLGTDKEKGSGLGLVLCRELIHLLCGDLKVVVKHGKGTDFYFTIPDFASSESTKKNVD